MASEPLVGACLRLLAASKPGGRFLELGTGTGIATSWLLEGMDARSKLISVDNDGEVQRVASESLGEDDRLKLVTSGGLEFLRDQTPESFDLMAANPGFEILPMVWASGVVVAVRKCSGLRASSSQTVVPPDCAEYNQQNSR
jgi:protein-L-isoaspartate O-methyltransferase